MTRVVFVGPGRAGRALGHVLLRGSCDVRLDYVGRRPRPPDDPLFERPGVTYADSLAGVGEGPGVLVLSVPDDALAAAVRDAAAGSFTGEWAALHLSGMHDSAVLGPLRSRGFAVGTMHPLQALSHTDTALRMLPRSWFAVSGDPAAEAAARALVTCIGGRALTIPDSGRPLYHAAATLIAEGIPVLVEAASRWMADAGADQDQAREGLQGLLEGVVANMRSEGLGAATGPLLRGDVKTVARHLQTLSGSDQALYAQTSRALLRAVGPLLDPERVAAFDALLREYE